MNIRHSVKRNIGTKLLLVLMPAWLALTPHSVLADDAAGGNSTTRNINLTPDWQSILTTTAFLTGHTHYCTVVGSADALHRAGKGDCQYEFGLSLAPNVPAAGVTRTVELNDNTGRLDDGERVDDPNFMEVGSTAFFRVPAGNHTFRWMARKKPGIPAVCEAISDDASMTVNCFQRRLSGLGIVGPTDLVPAN